MNLVSSNFMMFPARDEETDASRGDHEGESRDEEKTEHEKQSQNRSSDVSVLAALTELFFNPFLDGYCKTPFCSYGDYLPPTCPAVYSAPDENAYPLQPRTPQQQQSHAVSRDEDDYGDICKSNSGASSGMSSRARRHRKPLAFAVGYGDELKDQEGRRVVITPSSSRTTTSPYRYRPAPNMAMACTCSSSTPCSVPHRDYDTSPHQTKSVVCKSCCTKRLREEGFEVPASRSSGSVVYISR